MYHSYILSAVLFLSCYTAVVSGQSNAVPRCFQFTWLGPRYNNESEFMSATCSDATRLAAGIPCQQPLVVSYDGSWPDTEYIWTHYSLQASCVLADNDVCAQYTYYFNGLVENSTSMCTRAVDTAGTAITRGCYHQTNGSFATRVCFCRSVPGGVPCNNAIHKSVSTLFLVVSVTILALLYMLY